MIIIINDKRDKNISILDKLIFITYINKKIGKQRFKLEEINKEIFLIDTFNNNRTINPDYYSDELTDISNTYSIKIYNFNDAVKEFCINSFGLTKTQCYGTEEDKNSITHIRWENLPLSITEKYSRKRRGSGKFKPASGFMTIKELLRVVQNDFMCSIDINSIGRLIYSIIDNSPHRIAIVNQPKYISDISLANEKKAKSIFIGNVNNKDTNESNDITNLPLGEYSVVLDSNNKKDYIENIVIKKVFNWIND